MQTLSKIESSGTTLNRSTFNDPLGLTSIYQSISEVTAGAVAQLRQPLAIWDENTLIAIGEQRAEGLLEVLPQLKQEVAYRIALMFVPYLQTEQELDFSIDIQPSRHFTATVTRREEPKLYLD